MAEQVKKKPVDPNSAKYKLGKIAADAYVDAMEAKKRGEKVAWVSSNFPVEIPETMGIATVYPENQAAGIAARGAGTRMCEEAESEGYSNDICAYAQAEVLSRAGCADAGRPAVLQQHLFLHDQVV